MKTCSAPLADTWGFSYIFLTINRPYFSNINSKSHGKGNEVYA